MVESVSSTRGDYRNWLTFSRETLDSRARVRARTPEFAPTEAGVAILPGPFLDFLDPWGNRVEIVSYENIQFTKAPAVLRGMGLAHLSKNESAQKELAAKGMAPE